MRQKMKILIIFIMGFTLLSGCAHVISSETRGKVNPEITFAELIKNPLQYKGNVFILGGVIVETIIERQGTLLEIYQTRLDHEGQPKELDRSEGRFMAYYKGFLDNEIWSKGRKVTVAGILEGVKTQKLGEIDYRYPYLKISEIHLWEKSPYQADPYIWGPWGRPWWGPWWGPHWYPYGYIPYRYRRY
jgi:outer membrane lipoprotein